MRQKITRALLSVVVLVMALSLSGCYLTISVEGAEDPYTYDGSGLVGPVWADEIEVIITFKGFIPSIPDLLIVELSGLVEPFNPSLANTIESQLYQALTEGDSPFDSVDMEEGFLGTDSSYKVTAYLVIDWPMSSGSASAAITLLQEPLSTIIGADAYAQLDSALKDACNNIPLGTSVGLDINGTLKKTAKDRVIGTMLLKFLLNGSLLPS